MPRSPASPPKPRAQMKLPKGLSFKTTASLAPAVLVALAALRGPVAWVAQPALAAKAARALLQRLDRAFGTSA